MPFIDLETSPLAAGVSPVRIRYRVGCLPENPRSTEREALAERPPILFLHSGWGYEIYPFGRQMPAFDTRHRIVAPDRSGYGRSMSIATLPADFHLRAAEETRAVIAALGLARPVLWGHSDGAIIALLLALETPGLVSAVIAEATHFYKRKPRSREFFASMIGDGRALGESVTSVLERDHGTQWPKVIERHSLAWQRIAEGAVSDSDDFYSGQLGDIAVPVLVIHGARDPRTEPGEIEAIEHALGVVRGVRLQADLAEGAAEARPERARPSTSSGRASRRAGPYVRKVVVLAEGGHSPHSEPATADDVSRIALDFIDGIRA